MKLPLIFIFLICMLPSNGQIPAAKISMEEECKLQYWIADSLYKAGEISHSMTYLRWIIENGEAFDNKELLSDAMTGLGKSYEFIGKHDSAFAMYMESYKLMSKSNDTLRLARGLRDMAQLLRVLRQLDNAQQYCNKALNLIPGIKDPKTIANIYNEYAYLFELSGELDSAAYYYKKLIDISIQNKYRSGESVGYSNLASVYEQEKKYEEALALKKQGLQIDLNSGDVYGTMTSYRAISATLLMMQQYEEAIQVLKKAEKLCDTSLIMDLGGIEYGFYQAFKGMGASKEALYHFEKYNELNERINKFESTKKVADLLTKYETEVKEQKIIMLGQANHLKEQKIMAQRLMLILMSLIGLILVMFFWWWANKKNESLRRMKAELHHFILNQEERNILTEPNKAYLKWGLTDRESEVLYYLGQGCSNAHIAEKLYVSTNTVKFHIKNIYLKLDVKNRIQALMRCNESIDH